jgi:hypothetical protein
LTILRLATIMSELALQSLPMDLTAGQYIGPYEIVAPLGLAEWATCIAPTTPS